MKLVKEKINEVKAGSVPDPTMPVYVPKNNAKMFKYLQKSAGIKTFNKGAELEEDLSKDTEERMDGLTPDIDIFEKYIKTITRSLYDDGFDKHDIMEYLQTLIRRNVNMMFVYTR